MNLNEYALQSRKDNDKWWWEPRCNHCEGPLNNKRCLDSTCPRWSAGQQEPVWRRINDRNKGELIALMHSELSECLEGVRKKLMDDKLPHRTMEEVELADLLIRVFDYAGNWGLDLEGAYQEKRAYNATRADHSHEARLAAGGKAF